MAEDRRVFGFKGDWSTTAQDPGVWYSIVCKGGCRFMAVWVKEEEKASENRQRKKKAEKAEKADKVGVAPGVIGEIGP